MPPQQWSGSSLHCHSSGRWWLRWVQPDKHTEPPIPSPGGLYSSGDPPCKTEGGRKKRKCRKLKYSCGEEGDSVLSTNIEQIPLGTFQHFVQINEF